jgi:hypothetical protein
LEATRSDGLRTGAGPAEAGNAACAFPAANGLVGVAGRENAVRCGVASGVETDPSSTSAGSTVVGAPAASPPDAAPGGTFLWLKTGFSSVPPLFSAGT